MQRLARAAHTSDNTWVNLGILVLSQFLTLVLVVTTTVVALVVLFQESKLTNQFIVYTGVRTLSADNPSLFPVSSQENDAYSRAYGCMMDTEIAYDTRCDLETTIKGFQACIRSLPGAAACDRYVDSKFGFLQCLQSKFNVTIAQSDGFVECLDLSQGVTYETIQNLNSPVFLGSYNYAVLLLSGLTVMSSFVVLTSGGWFQYGRFDWDTGKEHHIYGIWSPFSIWRIYVAWIWMLAALFAACWVSLASMGNVANLDDQSQRFPATLWTCALSVGIFALLLGYYSFYVFEWMWAGKFAVFYSGVDTAPAPADDGQLNPPELPALAQLKRPHWGAHSNLSNRLGRRGQVGVQIYEDPTSIGEGGVTAKHIMPLMLQAFSWTWVFSDGLFFVGLLTPQTSISNESVVRVFVAITAARLFQLSGSYMANKAFIADAPAEEDGSRTGVIFAAIFVQVASLMCVTAAATDYISTGGLSKNAADAADASVSGHSIQLAVVLVLVVAPELWRTFNLVVMTYNVMHQHNAATGGNETMLLMYELLFTWEWLSRLIIAPIAIFSLATVLRDQHLILSSFLSMSVL